MEDTKRLVSSAAGSQEQLAEAAQIAVRTIISEADHVKLVAASLGSDDMEAQPLLLTAMKDVAIALGDLILAMWSASGKSVQDPSMEQLKRPVYGAAEDISKGRERRPDLGEKIGSSFKLGFAYICLHVNSHTPIIHSHMHTHTHTPSCPDDGSQGFLPPEDSEEY